MKTTVFRSVLLILFLALLSGTIQSQIFLNEFMAANASVIVDPDFSNASDWLEVYNAGGAAVDLSGYYLTDNLSDTTTWTIPSGTVVPANGFLLIWADGMNTGLHTSFKLSSLGEELGIYDPNEILVDGFIFPSQETDVSYGRMVDGDATWQWFSEPTPGTTNNASIPYAGVTYYQPFFSQNGGFFEDPISLEITSLGGTIHYTLDGRTPEESDPIYSTPIPFSTSTFIRARVFVDGFIPGPTITQSYFFDPTLAERGLPVVSLVTDPDFFWDPVIGIYVQDFKPEWEQPLNIEFFENDGNNQAVFNMPAGVKVNGLYSWQLPQKMLGIYFRNQYGSNHLDYPIFHDRDQSIFREFILRASGSDWSYTLFRDGLCQSLTQENGPVLNQGFRQSIVFINGEYMGIHNMRSRSNGDNLEQLYGLASNSYDIINNGGEIEEGDDVQYQEMNTRLNANLSIQANYDSVAAVVDVQNFTDYWITEIWSSNSSWGHNVKFWKPKDGGKWQFLLGDLDRGFVGSADNGLDEFSVPQGNEYDYGRYWLQHMFQNPEYAAYFAQRFTDHLYTTFHPVRVSQKIDGFQNPLLPEIAYHVDRWSGTTSNYGDGISTVNFWENEVQALRVFAQERQPYMMADLQSKFSLDDYVSLGTASLPNDGGSIRINTFHIPQTPWTGPYFMNMPFELSAVPNPGFTFLGWSAMELTSILSLGETWKYRDDGMPAEIGWTGLGYDDSSWSSGNAELGYGDGDEATVVSYGPDANNKYITTYFRKEFIYTGDDSSPVSCILNIRRDDGAVVYLNGEEIVRSNMPSGTIDNTTPAIDVVGGAAESSLNEFLLSLPLITGTNVLSAEVHQVNGTSSDISFDVSLSAQLPSETILTTDSVIPVTLTADAGFIARYIPTGACLLPDTIAENTTLVIGCSPYLASGDTYVLSGITLSVDPGVEVWFPNGARLVVEGDLQVNGTEENGVLFKANAAYGATAWGNITFDHSTAVNHLHYFEMKDATNGTHPVHHKAALSAWFSELELDHVTLLENFDNPIYGEYSNFTLTNCTIHSPVSGDLINVKYGHSSISECVFIGNDQPDTDGIDYDLVEDGVIRNCVVSDLYGSNSDAVDLGEACTNILVENCLLHDCSDKGVSCGQSSTALVQNTTIVNCNLGFGVKDLGDLTVDHVSLYSDVIGVACYEKNPGLGGGTVTITNSILSNSSTSPVFVDGLSVVDATNCFYDTDTMAGETNTWMDPLFVNPTNYDFQLQGVSPALGAGLDGEDLGTLDHSYTSDPRLMFSDIQYFNLDTADKEFIRIFNSGSYSVDISNHAITGGISFVFPEGTTILPGEKVTVVKDLTLFPDLSGQVFQWTSGQLNNGGEVLLLVDAEGVIIDYVDYDDAAPWPIVSLADQYITLIAPSLDNHFASSWVASAPILVGEIDPTSLLLFPNPANATLSMISSEDIRSISIYDDRGRLVLDWTGNGLQVALDIHALPPGLFMAVINERSRARFLVQR